MRAIAAAPPARRGGLGAPALAAALPVLIGFVAPALYLVWETAKRLRQGGGISHGSAREPGQHAGAWPPA